MFQITVDESANLKPQNATSSWGGTRKLPLVFTEQGVAMLSGVLSSDRAISVNIQIMRIFTKIRQALMDNAELRLAIEEIKSKTDTLQQSIARFSIHNTKNIEVIFQYLDELLEKKEAPKQEIKKIGYNVK